MSPLGRALNQLDCSSRMRKPPGEDQDTQGEQGHGKMGAEPGGKLSQLKELLEPPEAGRGKEGSVGT